RSLRPLRCNEGDTEHEYQSQRLRPRGLSTTTPARPGESHAEERERRRARLPGAEGQGHVEGARRQNRAGADRQSAGHGQEAEGQEVMPTDTQNLDTAISAARAALAALYANPQPDYSIGGQSVSWSAMRASLVKELNDLLQQRLRADGPFEIRAYGQ